MGNVSVQDGTGCSALLSGLGSYFALIALEDYLNSYKYDKSNSEFLAASPRYFANSASDLMRQTERERERESAREKGHLKHVGV